MEKKATLFEYVYRQLVSDIEQGALRYGDALPSLHDLCDRFRVGIRTIRDVQRALKADGYIVVEERKRAVVAYRPADDADDGRIRALLARREVVDDCYRTLELVMPPLFHLAARCCSDEDLFALAQDAKRVDRSGVSEGWRISHASIVLHGLVAKAGNPLFTSCFASLERIGLVPVVPGFESPFASRAVDVDGGLMTWMFSSLLLRDADEVQYRFGCMYRGVAQRVGAYFDALENAYAPAVDIGSFGYAWNAKAGLEFVHGQIARNLVERIVRGEFVDGQLLPSIAELSAQYGVSASTVQKAYGALNVIGVARTVNGLGTRVQLGNATFSERWLEDHSFKRDVGTYVHAAQMMCAVLPAALSRVQGHAEEVASSAERALAVEEGDWAVSKALITGLIECTEPCALQTILRELNDLLRWGAFLTLFAASRESASALSSLESIALGQARRADDEGFSQSMTAYYRLMLQSVLAFLERAGMIDVDRTIVP